MRRSRRLAGLGVRPPRYELGQAGAQDRRQRRRGGPSRNSWREDPARAGTIYSTWYHYHGQILGRPAGSYLKRGNTGIDHTFRSYVNVHLPPGVAPDSEEGLAILEEKIMEDAQEHLDQAHYHLDMVPEDVVVEIGGTSVDLEDLDELRSGGRLQRLAMYGVNTPIKHWNDVSVPGDQMCVIDALWYYIYKMHHSRSNVTLRGVRSKAQIVDEMTKILSPVDDKGTQWSPKLGVSVEQLVKYVRTKDLPFNVYAVDPFEFVFFSDTNTNGRAKNERSIVLKMHGEHATLIHDTHLVNDVAQSVGTYSTYVARGFNSSAAKDWPRFNYKKEFDEWWADRSHLGVDIGDPFGEQFDDQFITERFINRLRGELCTHGRTGVVVHNMPTMNIPGDHFLPLIISQSKHHVEHVLFNGRGGVTAMLVPGNPPIQINFAHNYEEVQELAQKMDQLKLMKLSQRTDLSATNISKMSKDYYLSQVGYWPKTQLNGHVWKTLIAHKVGGLQQTYEDCKSDIAIDITKCYASCLIDNQQAYPVFDVLSDWQVFIPGVDIDEKGRFKIGLFHITEPLIFPWLQNPNDLTYANRAVFPYQILSTNFVEWCVQKGILDPSSIDAWLPARGTIPADTFREPTEKLLELGGKQLINRFVGMCGRTERFYSKGAMVYDKEIATTLHGTYLFRDQVSACVVDPIYKRGEKEPVMYNVRFNESTPILDDSNIGVYWTIICAGFMKLMQLAERVFTEFGYTIKAVVTDSVVVDLQQHPHVFFERMRDTLLNEDTTVPGHYRVCYESDLDFQDDNTPLKFVNLRKSFVGGLEQFRRATARIGTLIPKWNRLEDLPEGSFLVDGMPGSGKSWTLANRVYTPGNTLVMTYTATSMENLHTAFGITENVCTFEKIETKCSFKGSGPGGKGNASHHSVVEHMSLFDKIVADEYSNMSAKWVLRMTMLKIKYPHVQIALFGDKQQTRPVCKQAGWAMRYKYYRTRQSPEMTYDALKSSGVMFICDYNMVRLSYREDCGRFDKPLQQVVTRLVEGDWFDSNKFKTATSPCNCRYNCRCSIERITQLPDDHDYDAGYHIVKTNKLKAVIDKLSMERHNAARQDILHLPHDARIARRDGYSAFDLFLSEGIRMICSKGGETKPVDIPDEKEDGEDDDEEDLDNPERELTRFYNGQRFVVYTVDVDKALVCLKKVGGTGGVLKDMTKKEIATYFELDYAVTAYRSQSQTMYNNVYVHQCWNMPRSELIVAISRATTINNVYLCGAHSKAVHEYNEDRYQTADLVQLPFISDIKLYTLWEVEGYDPSTHSDRYYYGYTPSTDMKVIEEDIYKKTQSSADKPMYFIVRQGQELSWKILTTAKYTSEATVKRDIEYIWPLRGLDYVVCDNEEEQRKLAKHFTTRAKRLYANAVVPIVNELPAVRRGRPPKKRKPEDAPPPPPEERPPPIRKLRIVLDTTKNGNKGLRVRVSLGTHASRKVIGTWKHPSTQMASKIADKFRAFIDTYVPAGTVDFKDYNYGGRDTNEYNLRHFFENTLGYTGDYHGKMSDEQYTAEFEEATAPPEADSVSQHMPRPIPNAQNARIHSDATEARAKNHAREFRDGCDQLRIQYLDTLETHPCMSQMDVSN